MQGLRFTEICVRQRGLLRAVDRPRPKADNRRVTDTRWQQRIRRAENLAAEHPFAKEILGFYLQLASFQRDLYVRLDRASARIASVGASEPQEQPELLASFPQFLALMDKRAPTRLAEVARDLAQSPADLWKDLLNEAWFAPEQPPSERPSDPREFLVLAFLQPYAEFERSRVPLQLEGYTHVLCPFCSRKPGLAVLRPLGEGAKRNLLCGFCLCEWEFRRIVCPAIPTLNPSTSAKTAWPSHWSTNLLPCRSTSGRRSADMPSCSQTCWECDYFRDTATITTVAGL
jgi:formate dehydrogenase maturation protein FdhE